MGILRACERMVGQIACWRAGLPRMQALYAFAAADLNEPRLLDLVRDAFPIYAWTYQERHAWTTTRARTARFVLSWLTSPTDRGMARN
jgi:hypothetical protein